MPIDILPTRIADFAACLRLFSRWPVPRLSSRDDPAALPELPRAAAMIPLAGAVLALPAATAGALLHFSGLPPLAVGLVVVALLTAPTGALHEDGLADTADGLFGGRDRDGRLAIMKDSRIGSFGALALIISIGFAATLYGRIAAIGPRTAFTMITATGGLSRLAMVWLWQALPAARSDGLSATLGRPDLDAAVGASLAGLPLALILLAAAGPVPTVLGLAAAAAAAFGLGRLALMSVGGQTGDILGAAQKLAELALLLGLCLLR